MTNCSGVVRRESDSERGMESAGETEGLECLDKAYERRRLEKKGRKKVRGCKGQTVSSN